MTLGLVLKDTSKLVGKCIYCGSIENLSNEHVIPYGLGANLTLIDASCSKHRDITSRFEGEVLRKQFINLRTTQKFPSRHKNNRPEYFEFIINGEKKIVPVEDCPTMFMMLWFLEPRSISDYSYDKGIGVTGTSTHGKNLEVFQKKYAVREFAFSQDLGSDFARLIAKIAYCSAVFRYGLDSLEDVNILPSIKGEKDDIGYWVGCPINYKSGEDIPLAEIYSHKIEVIEDNGHIRVKVRLFANYRTPEYLVIVGKLKK